MASGLEEGLSTTHIAGKKKPKSHQSHFVKEHRGTRNLRLPHSAGLDTNRAVPIPRTKADHVSNYQVFSAGRSASYPSIALNQHQQKPGPRGYFSPAS